jgi:hypothetical protein
MTRGGQANPWQRVYSPDVLGLTTAISIPPAWFLGSKALPVAG